MRRSPGPVVVLLVAALAVAAPIATATATPHVRSTADVTATTAATPTDVSPVTQASHARATTPENESDGNDSAANDSVSSGQRLGSVIGVQQAEVKGEMAERSLGQQLGAANSTNATAAVVAGQVERIDERLSAIRSEMEALRAARANGSIGEGEFRARMAPLAARAQVLGRLANHTTNASAGVPADVLESRGVNTTRLAELRENARNLTGPEVAAIARGIAGNDTGKPVGAGPPEGIPAPNGSGPPDDGDRGAGAGGGSGNGSGNGSSGPPDAGGGASSGNDAGDTPGNGSDATTPNGSDTPDGSDSPSGSDDSDADPPNGSDTTSGSDDTDADDSGADASSADAATPAVDTATPRLVRVA
jgi:hypothetical protein